MMERQEDREERQRHHKRRIGLVVGEVSRYQQYVHHPDVREGESLPASPPVSQSEKEKGHAQDEVVEPHVKQVVVGEDKSNQSEKRFSLLNAVEEIEQG